jgi:SPP1 gp7 family putative phage head morphogenesis protein
VTSPATAVEQPAKVPPNSEVEQLTTLLVSAASAAAVVGFLANLPGIGFEAANHLSAMSQVDAMLQLKVPHGVAHPAVMQQHLSNLRRRAAYLIMAGRRLGTAVVRERNQPGTLEKALRAEATYVRQHLQAVAHRNDAVKKTVAATYRYGDELGWWAVRDDRTSPECKAAHGSNFQADQPPKIGYPGTVHNRCRCKPGPPHHGGRTVDEATAGTDRVRVVRGKHKEAVSLAREVDSRSLPDLPNKPGKTNWVEESGGLPSYIKRIAKHLQANGHSTGSAIATAVNTVRRWAAGGTVTASGGPRVSAKTQALAAAAYAEWKAKAASAHR